MVPASPPAVDASVEYWWQDNRAQYPDTFAITAPQAFQSEAQAVGKQERSSIGMDGELLRRRDGYPIGTAHDRCYDCVRQQLCVESIQEPDECIRCAA